MSNPNEPFSNMEITNDYTNEYTNDYNKEFNDKLLTYRNMIVSFINTNKADLLKIYMQHRNNAQDDLEKTAILGIQLIIDDKPTIDIAYLPVHILETEISKKIYEQMAKNNEHIIYFLMITPCEEQILEIDVRDLL
jgi:hypothetical protein